MAASNLLIQGQCLILDQFLRPLKISGFDLTFFGCDRDGAEIAAIQRVWPATTVQLCFWHAKRTIRTKLKDSNRTNTQKHYFPSEAQNLIPTAYLMAPPNWDQPRFRVIPLANARRNQALVCFGRRKGCPASSPAVFLASGCQTSIPLARSRNASLSSPSRKEIVSPSFRSGIRSS